MNNMSDYITRYENHDIVFTYRVEPEYWTFYLELKVDETETLRSVTYELPRALKILSWVIEDVPVHIITQDIPYIWVYWGGAAIGLNVKETVNIQSALDYIRLHFS